MQPVIHVSADGRTAKIRARLFQMGGPSGGEGSWISGIYENTSVDEGGTWKLSGMDLDYVWRAPSRGGWVRVKTPPVAPEVAMARDFPPDRPLRGSIAAPFPKVHAVPFHYSNPVSGRVPPVLFPERARDQCERQRIELMRFPLALIEDASTGVAVGLVSARAPGRLTGAADVGG